MKKNSGITLVALVITIIVLLILAGVTIALVFGDNGILTRASDSKKTTEKASGLEELKMVINESYMDDDHLGSLTLQQAAEAIKNEYSDDEFYTDQNKTSELSFTLTNGKYTYDEEFSAEEFYVLHKGYLYKIVIENSSIVCTPVESDSSETSGSGISPMDYGELVEYSTTLRGQRLDRWEVFYQEGDYVWLILEDYLPSNAVPTSGLFASGYRVYSDSRANMLNAFVSSNNWSDLINNGSFNGTALSDDVKNDPNVRAMGAPTLELFQSSWNAKYPNENGNSQNELNIAKTAEVMGDGNYGYFVSRFNTVPITSPPPDAEYTTQMAGSDGYLDVDRADKLYFPHAGTEKWYNTEGYWLNAGSAQVDSFVMCVFYNGYITNGNNTSARFACRPVICLPASLVLGN